MLPYSLFVEDLCEFYVQKSLHIFFLFDVKQQEKLELIAAYVPGVDFWFFLIR